MNYKQLFGDLRNCWVADRCFLVEAVRDVILKNERDCILYVVQTHYSTGFSLS